MMEKINMAGTNGSIKLQANGMKCPPSQKKPPTLILGTSNWFVPVEAVERTS